MKQRGFQFWFGAEGQCIRFREVFWIFIFDKNGTKTERKYFRSLLGKKIKNPIIREKVAKQ